MKDDPSRTEGQTQRLSSAARDVLVLLARGWYLGTSMALILCGLVTLFAVLFLPPPQAIWAFIGFQLLLVLVTTLVRKFAIDAQDYLDKTAQWVSIGSYYFSWWTATLGIALAAISAVPIEIGAEFAMVLIFAALTLAVSIAAVFDRRLSRSIYRSNLTRVLECFREVITNGVPRHATSSRQHPRGLFGGKPPLDKLLRMDAKFARGMAFLSSCERTKLTALLAPPGRGLEGRLSQWFGSGSRYLTARPNPISHAGMDRPVKVTWLGGKTQSTVPKVAKHLSTTRRFQLSNGQDVWEGEFWINLSAGERVSFLHCSISPPFSVIPQVEATVLEGKDVRAKVAKAYPFGARIELRRAMSDLPERVKIRVRGVAKV